MKDKTIARLLIVDDEAAHTRALCDTLAPHGYVTRGFTSGREALAALQEEQFDLLLTDLMMPEMDGIALLRACREIDRNLACVIMTGHGTIDTAVSALKTGALDYVLKPFRMNIILPVLDRALTTRRLQLENIQLRESVSIYELSRAITQGLEPAQIVESTLAAAIQQSDAAAVCVLLPSPDGQRLTLAGACGRIAAQLANVSFANDAALAGWVGRVREELAVERGTAELRAMFAHPFGETNMALALPIFASGKFFGVLGFSAARPERRISRGQVMALDILAGTAATAFETASLVTQLKRMNEELERRVLARTRELEIANTDLEAFSYSVSHDLREPLRAVEGFCEIFRSEYAASVPERGQQLLQHVWAGASRMNRLINDLLHFARFTREPLFCMSVPLREIVEQCVARLQAKCGTRNVTVQIGELPECFGDAALLEQALVNLLSNAFKFTVGRDPAQINIGALRQGGATVYFVRDNGVGFDMKYVDKLFGVFQRLHSQDEFEGTGIGLSIVQRIIQRHGGRVWADSQPNVGTTFYFSVPEERVASAA